MVVFDPHQAAAVAWLQQRPRAMLAWEMGCGKTAPAVRAWEENPGGRLLVLCLASARENWRREIAKYAIDRDWPPRAQAIYNVRSTEQLDPHADVVICNYHKLLNPRCVGLLRTQRWGAMVLDEAHMLKSPDAQRTKFVYGGFTGCDAKWRTPLVDRAERVWLLTGTPIPNHPGELFTHAAKLWPDRLQYNGHTMAQWEFEAAFCDIAQTQYGPKIIGARNMKELRERLDDVIHVVKRQDVLNLPPISITTWPLDGEMIRLPVPDLPGLLGRLAEQYGPPDAIDTFDLATVDAYLAAIESEAIHLATVRRQISHLKAILVGLMVDEEIDSCSVQNGTVIWAHHRDAITAVAKILARHKPVVIHGDVPAGQRQREIDRFHNDPACRVFIGQITAAGSSINLQEAASSVIMLEASWTPGENDQAIGRVYRRGQKNPVSVRYAFLPGTIDEAVQRALARKTAMISQLL